MAERIFAALCSKSEHLVRKDISLVSYKSPVPKRRKILSADDSEQKLDGGGLNCSLKKSLAH